MFALHLNFNFWEYFVLSDVAHYDGHGLKRLQGRATMLILSCLLPAVEQRQAKSGN